MRQGIFLPESTSGADSVMSPYSPHVRSHASTSVHMLKIPNSGSHMAIFWTHEQWNELSVLQLQPDVQVST